MWFDIPDARNRQKTSGVVRRNTDHAGGVVQKGKVSRQDDTTLSLAKAAAVAVFGLVVAGLLLTGGENRRDNARAALESSVTPDTDGNPTADQSFSLTGLIFGGADTKTKSKAAIPAASDGETATQFPARVADPGSVEAYIAESDDRGIHIGKQRRARHGKRLDDDPLAAHRQAEEPDEETSAGEESIFDEVMVEEALYARDGAISGRVVNESGMPIIGVGVTATAIHLFDIPADASIPVHDLQRYAVSDTAGVYSFDQLVPGEYRIQNVPTADYGMTRIAVRSGVNFADLALKTQRALTVSGVVTDTIGQPLAGVLVKPMALGAGGSYTDSGGQFVLQLQMPSESKTLGIGAALMGYRDKMTLLGTDRLSLDQAATINIQLEPIENRTFVTGTVVSAESGLPITGKTVQLTAAGQRHRHTATTGTDGRFMMPAVEAGDQYELLITGGGGFAAYIQPNISIPLQGLEMALTLQPDELRVLTGQMVNLNGTPIPNFSMVVRAAKPPYQAMRISSDASGNFVLQNPPSGQLVFESQSDPLMVIGGVDASGPGGQQVSLMLDIGRDEIFGSLIDAEGQPVAATNVVLSWRHERGGIVSTSSRRGAADSQGRFSFRELGPGTHVVRINVDGYKPARVEHDPATKGYEFVIELEAESSG